MRKGTSRWAFALSKSDLKWEKDLNIKNVFCNAGKMLMGKGRLIILTLILLLGYAQAANITVGPATEDYPQIQKAIANSTNGDTIEVHSGIYRERVGVFRSVTLMGIDTGDGLPVIDAGGLGNAITLMANGSTVKGFNLTGSTGCACSRNAGIQVASNNNTISNNVFYRNKYGIYVRMGSINNTFVSNDFLENEISARDQDRNSWNSSSQKSDGLQGILELFTGTQMKGNHYSDYDEPEEGCEDSDKDGICDLPKRIESGSSFDHRSSVSEVN